MSLEKRYNDATSPTFVHLKTVGAAGARGVNFLDGNGVAPKTTPPNTYQREFTPNKEGSFRYGATGQNNLNVGVDATDEIQSVTSTSGLTRWTSTALAKAFLAGNSSLLTKYKTFRGKTYHTYSPLVNGSFFEAGGLSEFAKLRANPNSPGYGPGVAGLAG